MPDGRVVVLPVDELSFGEDDDLDVSLRNGEVVAAIINAAVGATKKESRCDERSDRATIVL